MLQNCFYVPSSLRSKAAIARTLPAGTQGVVEQNLGRRNPGNLFNRKPVNNYSPAKSQAYLSPGVQRKLDLNYQNATKADKNLNNYVKQQPKYLSSGMNGPPAANNLGTLHTVSEATEKLANLTVGSGRPLAKPLVPPPMKAGGWHEHPNPFLQQSQDLVPGSGAYARRVA